MTTPQDEARAYRMAAQHLTQYAAQNLNILESKACETVSYDGPTKPNPPKAVISMRLTFRFMQDKIVPLLVAQSKKAERQEP